MTSYQNVSNNMKIYHIYPSFYSIIPILIARSDDLMAPAWRFQVIVTCHRSPGWSSESLQGGGCCGCWMAVLGCGHQAPGMCSRGIIWRNTCGQSDQTVVVLSAWLWAPAFKAPPTSISIPDAKRTQTHMPNVSHFSNFLQACSCMLRNHPKSIVFCCLFRHWAWNAIAHWIARRLLAPRSPANHPLATLQLASTVHRHHQRSWLSPQTRNSLQVGDDKTIMAYPAKTTRPWLVEKKML